MQNYAKFESRIASDSLNSVQSMNVMPDLGYSFNWYNNFFTNLFEYILIFLWGFIFLMSVLFCLYVIISLFTKWWEKTAEEIKKLFMFLQKIFINFLKFLWKKIKFFSTYFYKRKKVSLIIILLVFVIWFWNNVLSGNSKLIRISKIGNWYVWVDLKNNKIIPPGYFLYSPVTTSYFLSPTNNFDFEIVEVTANTSEELGVTLDYRVGFKIIDEKRLDFYNKYGAKNIQLVSSDIVMPRLLESIKWIIKSYSFKDISSKHSEIKNITLKEANAILKDVWIELQDINILDIRLPETYLKSKQDLLNAENELKLAEAKLETQKKESERKLLEANNNKNVSIIEAEAVAESNKIINSTSITSEMLKMKEIENQTKKINKWDGKLPTTVWDNMWL